MAIATVCLNGISRAVRSTCNISAVRGVLTSVKRYVLSFAVVAAVLFGGLEPNTFAAAEKPVARRAIVVQRVKEKLGITDEQVAKIKDAVASEKEGVVELLGRLHTARTELRNTVQRPDATENEIRGAAAKLAAVEADGVVLRAKLHKKIGPLLTSEQQEKLKAMQSNVGRFVDHLIDRVGERLAQ